MKSYYLWTTVGNAKLTAYGDVTADEMSRIFIEKRGGEIIKLARVSYQNSGFYAGAMKEEKVLVG